MFLKSVPGNNSNKLLHTQHSNTDKKHDRKIDGVAIPDELNKGDIDVVRNNLLHDVNWDLYGAIVISPGPGLPKEAGELLEYFPKFIHQKKVLGVCLGLQAVVEFFGGSLSNLTKVVHGQKGVCDYVVEVDLLFKDLSKPVEVGRYHSWVADQNSLPNEFEVLAKIENEIMAIKHNILPIYAVQFHPESVLTPQGKLMLKNWLEI